MGVKGSAVVNSILTVVNLCVMALVVIVGFYYADIDNWTIEGEEQPSWQILRWLITQA